MEPSETVSPVKSRWKTLSAASLAHATHDGYTDMLYVFFPLWQAQLSLSFAQVGLLKTLFSGALALFQIPSGMLAEKVGERRLLLAGTLLLSLTVFCYGWADTSVALGLLLFSGGLGASVQHPISSTVVLHAYRGGELRRALSIFNLSGDIGKMIVPALAALLVSRTTIAAAGSLLAMIGLLSGLLILSFLKKLPADGKSTEADHGSSLNSAQEGGFVGVLNPAFVSLSVIAVIDSATRTGLLTFLPFILQRKGAGITTIGLALSLIFAGGAAGKFVCGVMATRVGILRSVCLTEAITAGLIGCLLLLPLHGALALTPVLGIALNGTSSVLSGSVPELVPESGTRRAFSIYYTAAIGSGAVAPTLFGLLGDRIGIVQATCFVALFVLLASPLTLPLRGRLWQQVV